MTENKRFGIIKTKTYGLYVPVDKMKVYNFSSFEDELDCIRVVNALNGLEEKRRENDKIASKYLEENELLKKSVNNLKDTIVTIGIAYQKKHGRTLVDLVDGTLEEDIIDLRTDL